MKTRSKQLTCSRNSDEKARRIMRRAFLRAVRGECWGRKAVDGVQVTGGLPSNGMPAGAFRPARE